MEPGVNYELTVALFPEHYLWARCVPQDKHGYVVSKKKFIVDFSGSEMSINKEILKVALLALVP